MRVIKTNLFWLYAIIHLALPSSHLFAASCDSDTIKLQILGSRGPELLDENASTGYLVWIDGKAKIMIDAGPGSLQRYKQAGADFTDLDIILFTHFHADHSADFIGYMKAAQFTGRKRNLIVSGPSGSDFSSSLTEFVNRVLNVERGLYPYLGNYISKEYDSPFKLELLERHWTYEDLSIQSLTKTDDYAISTVAVHHGAYPAIGYRIDSHGCSIAFTGDMSGRLGPMPDLAEDADILVAHLAIEEAAEGLPQILHMKPTYIGVMAKESSVKHLVLSHFMSRSLKHLDESLQIIKEEYKGPITLAEDLMILTPE